VAAVAAAAVAVGGDGGGGGGGGGGDTIPTVINEQIETLTNLRKATSTGTGINFLLKEQIDTLTDAMSTNALNALGDEQARLREYGPI
jgi:carbon monoxide dehydrogenase subunit G